MAVTPYRPSADLFRALLNEWPFEGARAGGMLRAPETDVVEAEKEIRVVTEIPGLRPEDIEIDIRDNVLTISGEKREERQEGDEGNTWHLMERRYGGFSRSFVLPRDVESERVQASCENGVLTVTIPKSERTLRRKIEVQRGRARPQPGEVQGTGQGNE